MPSVVRCAVARLSSRLHHRRARRLQAQDTGTYTSAPLEWGDGSASPGSTTTPTARPTTAASRPRGELQCTLATGHGFGAHRHRPGDRRRLSRAAPVGRRGRQRRRRLLPPRRTAAPTSATVLALDAERLQPMPAASSRSNGATSPTRRSWTRRATARPISAGVTTDRAICSPLRADGVRRRVRGRRSPAASPEGRAWVDVNGDGKADFCRVAGALVCTLSTGTGFGGHAVHPRPGPRLRAGRAWADIDGDGRADYCRRGRERRRGPAHRAARSRHAVRLRRQLHLRAAGMGRRDGLRVGGLRR